MQHGLAELQRPLASCIPHKQKRSRQHPREELFPNQKVCVGRFREGSEVGEGVLQDGHVKVDPKRVGDAQLRDQARKWSETMPLRLNQLCFYVGESESPQEQNMQNMRRRNIMFNV